MLFRSRQREGYAVRTLFTDGCIEKGLGVFYGGARYNNVQLECIGITNAADSLMAIKKAVFHEARFTFGELVEALKANFNGYEAMRGYLMNRVPKFGNDESEADEIRKDISRFIFNELRKQKGINGGIYVPGEVIFVAHEMCGRALGATPDGRLSGDVLADSAGAVQGMDIQGPTALMNSVLNIPVDELLTSIVLNIKFMKQLWNDASVRTKAVTMFKSFFSRGGMQLQVNVCDTSTLEDAVRNPQKHASLIVRVGGYSAYFTSLSPALQQDIIRRTSH